MKNSILIAIVFASSVIIFSACNNSTPKSTSVESATAKSEVYTCPMHPEIQSDKTGDCPKCGMKLVLMDSSDTSHMHNLPDTSNMMK